MKRPAPVGFSTAQMAGACSGEFPPTCGEAFLGEKKAGEDREVTKLGGAGWLWGGSSGPGVEWGKQQRLQPNSIPLCHDRKPNTGYLSLHHSP